MPALRRLAHRAIETAVAGFNRNPWTHEALELTPRVPHSLYRHDGLRTAHNHSFIETPDFQRAYGRAVQAAGWDYKIHWRVHVILWAATAAQPIRGAFVECGAGRGFMTSAICEHLSWTDRPFYLFDTFQPESVGAGPDGRNGARSPGVRLVVGVVPDSLDRVDVGSVAFVHIDMNRPGPEEAALRHFWPMLSPGGIIVLDDYAYAGFEASHESASRVAADLGFSLLSLPTGQGLTIKPPSATTR
jgi:hypothetical protein